MTSSKLTITFLGDFAPIGPEVQSAAKSWRPFSQVLATLRQPSLLVANLEVPLTHERLGKPFKWANLRAEPEVVKVLEGLDVAVLANNHISDFGKNGVVETQRLLEDAGISSVGYGSCEAEAIRPLILNLDGESIGILAFCCPTTNGENMATHVSEGVSPLGMELLSRAIADAKPRCKALFVYMHWGCEWVHDPVPDQLRLARHAVDCGADAVLGCHSHTIQSFEQYRGRWIFYGLGNFFFGDGVATELMPDGRHRQHTLPSKPANRESMAVTFSIAKNKKNDCASLNSVHYFRQSDRLDIHAISQDHLSFNLAAHNAKLTAYIAENGERLSQKNEIVFFGKLRNGIMAYWYSTEPIQLRQSPSLKRQIRALAKISAKKILPRGIYFAIGDLRRKWRRRLRARILDIRIGIKWFHDKRYLPLKNDHWELYQICHRMYWKHLNDLPNLVNPRDFNDRIQWLKLFDQTELHVQCSDKIRVRDYVRERVGDKFLVTLYQTCDSFDQIDFDRLPKSFVIKTNHDSGGVILVCDKETLDRASARERITRSLRRTYGWEHGEWAYSFVKPRVLVEEFIQPNAGSPPPDYKFYVVDGAVKFVHFIFERGDNTKEQTLSPSGDDLETPLYPSFELCRSFERPSCWDELIHVAETLGKDFKCVRVDLFEASGRIYVGEMTFWPMFGCYKGNGQKKLGQLLDFDRTTFKPPVYHKLKG